MLGRTVFVEEKTGRRANGECRQNYNYLALWRDRIPSGLELKLNFLN